MSREQAVTGCHSPDSSQTFPLHTTDVCMRVCVCVGLQDSMASSK